MDFNQSYLIDLDVLLKKLQCLKDDIELDDYDEDHSFFILSQVSSLLLLIEEDTRTYSSVKEKITQITPLIKPRLKMSHLKSFFYIDFILINLYNNVMKKKYEEWIYNNYPTPKSALNQCREACEAMVKAFPELKVTNGLVEMAMCPEDRAHWWCLDQDEIVDPTQHQYQAIGDFIIEYKEISDSHPLRNFERCRCANCGNYYFNGEFYHSATVCSSKCFTEFAKYLNGK